MAATDTMFITNYLSAPEGPARDDAAVLLSLTKENRPGEDVGFEIPLTQIGAAIIVPLKVG